MIDFKQIEKIVKENKSFLITTHVNPDADAIGSELAFYFILKKLGKSAFIVNHSETPYYLKFLDEEKIIEQFDPEIHQNIFENVDVLAALDFNNPSRIVKMKEGFINSRKLKICIDHHQNPGEFADYLFIDPDYAATGHLIFNFIETTQIVELDKKIAECLYSAIMTDTGSFRFDRTTPEIHRIAAKLIEAGANPTDIYDKIFDQSNYGKIKLLGNALSSIKINGKGEIAYMTITQENLLKSGAEESEVDGFVNNCLSIAGVKIGILFFELPDGAKISFRSKGKIAVNKLAEEFGGGGHTNAAGTRLFNIKLDFLIEEVLGKAESYLKSEN